MVCNGFRHAYACDLQTPLAHSETLNLPRGPDSHYEILTTSESGQILTTSEILTEAGISWAARDFGVWH